MLSCTRATCLSALSTAASTALRRQARGCLPPAVAACPPFFGSGATATTTVRHMSKYLSKSATKRLPLTPKRARKGYYKGNGATREGYFGKGGKFVVDPEMRLELVVPDLTGFKLRPYVAKKVPRYPPELKRDTNMPS